MIRSNPGSDQDTGKPGHCEDHIRIASPGQRKNERQAYRQAANIPGGNIMNVAIVGPFSRGVSFEVHAKGCADLNKARAKRHDPWFIDAESVQEIVEAVYGDQIAEARGEVEAGADYEAWTTWKGYGSEFKFLPCCPDLPEETPVAKPRRCYTIAELIERIAEIDPLCEPGSPEWREQTTLIRMLNAAEAFEASR